MWKMFKKKIKHKELHQLKLVFFSAVIKFCCKKQLADNKLKEPKNTINQTIIEV
jgi:hypothetical protein